jgi:D-glycero-beta-D-manno-heptose 1-phosphate adenylyltransferase
MSIRMPEEKMMTLEQAVAWRQRLGRRRLVVTNGCFDLLHRGHASYLARARALGDALLVAVNSDASVRTLKGPGRPVNHEEDRVYLLAALESVDAVLLYDTMTATALLQALRPDIYVKGGDYDVNTMCQEERHALDTMQTKVVFLPFVDGHSTTRLIQRLSGSG